MPSKKLIEWKNKGEHLPHFLRSADDQNNFVNFLAHIFKDDEDNNNPIQYNSLAILERYLFTVFFDYMADNGLTLQPINNSKIKFYDLETELKTFSNCEDQDVFEFYHDPKIYDAIEAYRQSLIFLPPCMTKFEHMKDIFKGIHSNHNENKKYNSSLIELNYRVGTTYIIDYVLWILAKYGYQLRKSTKRFKFDEITDNLR